VRNKGQKWYEKQNAKGRKATLLAERRAEMAAAAARASYRETGGGGLSEAVEGEGANAGKGDRIEKMREKLG